MRSGFFMLETLFRSKLKAEEVFWLGLWLVDIKVPALSRLWWLREKVEARGRGL